MNSRRYTDFLHSFVLTLDIWEESTTTYAGIKNEQKSSG